MTSGAVSHAFVDVDAGYDPAELARIAPGLQAQLREDFAAEYDAGQDDVVVSKASDLAAAPDVEVQLHAKAPANEQDALAYHTRTPDGRSIIHAFRDLLERFGAGLSEALSHELLENRADPDCVRCVELPDGRIASFEICDQVEALTYEKNGVIVSNFNLRANFAPRTDGQPEKYDFLGKQQWPFQVLDGGYAQVYDPAQGWTQLSSSKGMSAYRAELDARGLSRHARRRRRSKLSVVGRRAHLELNVPAELAIRNAMAAVEAMGADIRLTDAVVHLGKAFDHVADFVDKAR